MKESIESFAPLVTTREILRRVSLLGKTTTGTADREGQARGKHDDDHVRTQQIREETADLEEKLESLLVALQVFCFKQNLSVRDFVDVVYDVCHTANSVDVPLAKLPSHVKQLESDVERLSEEKVGLSVEKAEKTNRLLSEEIQKLRKELDKMTKERDMFRRDAMQMAISLPEEEDTNDELR